MKARNSAAQTDHELAPTADDVRAARFAKKMRGYAPAEVDEALRDALAELERRAP